MRGLHRAPSVKHLIILLLAEKLNVFQIKRNFNKAHFYLDHMDGSWLKSADHLFHHCQYDDHGEDHCLMSLKLHILVLVTSFCHSRTEFG